MLNVDVLGLIPLDPMSFNSSRHLTLDHPAPFLDSPEFWLHRPLSNMLYTTTFGSTAPNSWRCICWKSLSAASTSFRFLMRWSMSWEYT